MKWRVVATQMGQYNNCIIEEGSVFDLLCFADGSYPQAWEWEPQRNEAGQPVIIDNQRQWQEKLLFMKDGKTPRHRDFAEDLGNRMIRSGPKAGEVMRFGWMKLVPAKTPLGIYPPGTDFWSGAGLPQRRMFVGENGLPSSDPVLPIPPPEQRGEQNRKRNHAAILDVLPPEQKDEAA